MQVKDFLNKIRHIDMMIDCKCEQISNLRSRLTSLGSPTLGDKVQSTKDPDKFTNTVSKSMKLENKINADIDTLVELKNIARNIIERIDGEVEKLILYKRYFENKRFEEIAIECGYSLRHIYRLHDDALENFDKIYKDVIECHI